jgi:hypothetical protein
MNLIEAIVLLIALLVGVCAAVYGGVHIGIGGAILGFSVGVAAVLISNHIVYLFAQCIAWMVSRLQRKI